MKKLLHIKSLFLLQVLIAIFISLPASAQQTQYNFNDDHYRDAIENIIGHSGNGLDREKVLDILNHAHQAKSPSGVNFRGDTIYVVPEIAFALFDQTSVTFDYYPEDFGQDSVLVSFPDNPGWINQTASIDFANSEITIGIDANDAIAPRSTSVQIKGILKSGNIVEYPAYILQQGKPQKFILVSPKYQAIGPQGGATQAFTVTNFNVESWAAVFTETWIHVDMASLTDESITFNVDPNSGNISREATIVIQDNNDATVKDSLTIFQFVDTSNYIIATPSSGFIGSGATVFDVEVNSNIEWELQYLDVPAGMIPDSVVSGGGVSFNISANPGQGQRIANISIIGKIYPDISAQIVISQAGESPPYIFVSPANSYVGSGAGSVTLNVDANLNWETDIYNDPFNILFQGASTQTTVSFNISENMGTASRVAEGRIKAVGSELPADTFRIVQEASFILLNPSEKIVACEGEDFWVYISKYNVDSIVADTADFFGSVQIFGNDSLNILVPPNQGALPRNDTIRFCSFENPAICGDLVIFQYACNQSYIVISPKFNALPYEGGISNAYFVNSSNVSDWEVYFENPVAWIADTIIEDNTVKFELDENPDTETRQATFFIRNTSNPGILDSAIIFQDGGPSPVLIASPREQLVGFDGNESLDFNITYQNIDNWVVDNASIPAWINVDSAGGNLLSLDVLFNNSSETRQAEISITASNNPQINDSVFVFQYAINDAYIIAAPRSDTVGFAGNSNLIFKVTTANVANWELDTLQLADWIRVNEPHNTDTLSLTIDPNSSAFSARFDTLWIRSVNQPDTNDFVVIYQMAAPQSYLIAAPREQTIPWPGNPALAFVVTSVNASSWQVNAATVPEWINVVQSGGFLLLLNVAANNSMETRNGSIKIFNPNQPQITDSVKIYQYAKDDKYLIAAPRDRKYSQFGNEKSDFLITSANIDTWEVVTDSLPSWVELINAGADTLSLKVLENTSYQTRQTTVRIFASSDPGTTDSVFLFQYAANDTLLLASPRQQLVQFSGNNSVDFIITVQNAEAWKVDPETLNFGITVNNQGGDLLSLDVPENPSSLYRTCTIVIFDTINTSITDSVSVYQLAAPESYILASPRSDTILFNGGQSIFNIKAVDLTSNWTIDENTLPFWIPDYTIENDSMLVLNINPNISAFTLQAIIRIIDTDNPVIRDSISVFQYATPEKYLLAAPREQKIMHGGGIMFFEITSVNVDVWDLDTTTVPGWISDYNIAGNALALTVDPNTSLLTRETSLRIFADSIGSTVEDFVSVYQYSGLEHYLLASPRERKAGNLTDTLYFSIDTVNLSTWQAEILGGDTSWIETIISGADTLGLVISENFDTISRHATIRIFSEDYPNAEDMVSVYQYSPFEPFIIIDPTFNRFSSDIDSLSIYTFSNLDNYSVEQSPTEPKPTWYSLNKISGTYNDSVQLLVNPNENGYYGRSSYLIFRSPDSSFVNYFYFQQGKNSFNFINISGTVSLEGEQQIPIANVDIIIDFDTLHTDNTGFFTHQKPYGWVGIVRPEKFGYFFDPPNAVYNNAQEADILKDFTAFEINPKISFNIGGDTLAVCPGVQIDSASAEYPTISVSGTFGPRGYKWFSEPGDPNLNTDSLTVVANQVFSPELTTTYFLVIYNYGTTDTTSFTIRVNPAPVPRSIEGPSTVCRNQAGVIYTASDFENGEYFSWQLSYQGNLINEYPGNIAVIDWGEPPGDYELTLFTYNGFSCGVSDVNVISVSNEESPPKTFVQKKLGDNMLLCLNPDVELYNYEWGWYTMGALGELNDKYIIPGKNDWYCRLPDNHTFDPGTYKYFVGLTFRNGNGCESVSFLDNSAPVGMDESTELPYKIFPNPTHGIIRLQFFNLTGGEKGSCSIINTSGQVVYSNEWKQVNPAKIISISEAEILRPGVYIFRAEIGNKFYNSKIVVQ